MHVEIGPVSHESARAWLGYADEVLEVLRRVGADRTPTAALDAFEALTQEWRTVLSRPGGFRWSTDRPADEVGYMLNALYEAGLAVEACHEAGLVELRPAAADEFHYAIVNQALAYLEVEGGADAHLVDILREHWGVAGE